MNWVGIEHAALGPQTQHFNQLSLAAGFLAASPIILDKNRHWILEGRNLVFSMLCNATPSVGLLDNWYITIGLSATLAFSSLIRH